MVSWCFPSFVCITVITVARRTLKLWNDIFGRFPSPGRWDARCGGPLFLMCCGERWLLLLPDNITTTLLMLTGLYIHLSALGGWRDSARPFRPEFCSRSPSPITRELSPTCFCSCRPDMLNDIWIMFTPHGTNSRVFSRRIINSHVNNSDKIPTGTKATRCQRKDDRNSQVPARRSALQPYKPRHQSNVSSRCMYCNHSYAL